MKTYNLKKIVVLTGCAVALVGCAHQPTQAYHTQPAAISGTPEPVKSEAVSAYFPVAQASSGGVLVEKIVTSSDSTSYTYKVSNLTDKPLPAVTISDYIGKNAIRVASSPQATLNDKGVASWKLGSLNAKESKIITVNYLPLHEGTLITCNWLTDASLARQ
jgi:hypothetical protein